MRRCRPLLGTFVAIEGESEAIIAAGFAAIERVHRLMSAHDPDSELSRINRSAHLGPVAVDVETAEVIDRALHWSRASGGAFDVVVAGAAALERSALPFHPGQPAPDPAARWTDLTLDGALVSLQRPACLDLGGIAKGYAVDRAVAAMRAAGATGGLVNAGGDLRAFGPKRWPVAIVDPLDRRAIVEVDLQDSALATSAGLADSGELAFDHLLGGNPQWLSVTVRAAIACDADALTKIVWALGSDAAPLLAAAGAEAFALHRDGSVAPLETRPLAA